MTPNAAFRWTILHAARQDPTIKGISALGSDGIYRWFTADRGVVNAVPLIIALIEALLYRFPFGEESEKKFHGVNRTRSGSKKARFALCWIMV
ncbi:hypothetical protein FCULG_00005382 [Fusarium culmorum]|uniref:Uncharacterized protein n=1 Tax=Fusarium culmorum TaxID=5516 RepID=A0A2T4GXX6_FUSCU|nr:hypothetical protein FCULG_00005382 [Fusarium culmorum]